MTFRPVQPQHEYTLADAQRTEEREKLHDPTSPGSRYDEDPGSTGRRLAYLVSAIDCHMREIVGWKMTPPDPKQESLAVNAIGPKVNLARHLGAATRSERTAVYKIVARATARC